MMGIPNTSQRAKALENKKEQGGAKASAPKSALTTGDVVIEG
jgi:hypothetical protein